MVKAMPAVTLHASVVTEVTAAGAALVSVPPRSTQRLPDATP
jgi:hypothetical protein